MSANFTSTICTSTSQHASSINNIKYFGNFATYYPLAAKSFAVIITVPATQFKFFQRDSPICSIVTDVTYIAHSTSFARNAPLAVVAIVSNARGQPNRPWCIARAGSIEQSDLTASCSALHREFNKIRIKSYDDGDFNGRFGANWNFDTLLGETKNPKNLYGNSRGR